MQKNEYKYGFGATILIVGSCLMHVSVASIDGSGVPLSIDGSGYPMSIDDSGVPLSIDGSGYPMSIDGSGVPLSIDGSGYPLSIDGSGVPLSIDGSGYPLSIDGSGVPLSIDGSGYPMSIDGSGGPLSIDGSGYPLSIDGSGVPLSIDGSGYPMSIDGSGVPLSIDGSGQPALALGPIKRESSTIFSVLNYRFSVPMQQQRKASFSEGDYVLLSFSNSENRLDVQKVFVRRIKSQYVPGESPVFLFGVIEKVNLGIGSIVVNASTIDYLSLMSDPATSMLNPGNKIGIYGSYPQDGGKIMATRLIIY